MKIEKPLLIIPMENKVREFDAKLLLALVAVQQGFDVVVGALRELKFLVDLLDRGIYFDKSVAKTKQKWFAHCRRQGHRVVALDEEGLVYFDAKTYRQLRIYRESMAQVDIFFAWGRDQAEVMSEEIEDLSERIVVTGNPRFDLLRPEMRSFYDDDVSELKKRNGRTILVNTSFSFANSANDPNELLRTFSQYPINTEQPGFFEGWLQAQQVIMESMERAIPQIRRRCPDHNVVIRPHPSEKLEPWQHLADGLQGTQVIREGNVVPWILAADALVHWNCTTAIEAMILDIPAIAYKAERFDGYEQPLPNACSFAACSLDELLDKIKMALDKKLTLAASEKQARDKVLCHHLTSQTGEFAAVKMVESLKELSKTVKRRRCIHQRYLQSSKKIWRSILDLIDKSRQIRDPYVAVKFPDTRVEEVRDTVTKLSKCLNYTEGIAINEVSRNCFSLSVRN